MGLVAALLVFTGLWRLSEFWMDRQSRNARGLRKVGAACLVLGGLIALGYGGVVLGAITLLTVAAAGFFAWRGRKATDVRRWVIWALLLIDAIIALLILRQWV